jgi:hypothetical protein
MGYRKVMLEDRVLFFLTDEDIVELNSYQNFKRLINHSKENLDLLLSDIENGLKLSVEEELEKFKDDNNSEYLQKTIHYARLMQGVNHFLAELAFEKQREQQEMDRLREMEEKEI